MRKQEVLDKNLVEVFPLFMQSTSLLPHKLQLIMSRRGRGRVEGANNKKHIMLDILCLCWRRFYVCQFLIVSLHNCLAQAALINCLSTYALMATRCEGPTWRILNTAAAAAAAFCQSGNSPCHLANYLHTQVSQLLLLLLLLFLHCCNAPNETA